MLNKVLILIFTLILVGLAKFDSGRFSINLVQNNAIMFGMLYVGIIFYLMQESLHSVLVPRMRKYIDALFRIRYFFIFYFVITLYYAREYVAFYDISYFNEFTVGWFNNQFYMLRQFIYLFFVLGSLYYIKYKTKPEVSFNYLLLFLLSFIFIPFSYDLLAFVQDITIQHFWQSTIWSFYTFINLATFFIAVMLITNALDRDKDITVYTPRLATFLFGFNILWSYLFFSQFIIIWYANIPSEAILYNIRFSQPWLLYQGLVVILHLFVPFFFLFSKQSKVRTNNILIASYSTLMAVVLDMMCYFVPAFSKVGIQIYEYTFFLASFILFVVLYLNTLYRTRKPIDDIIEETLLEETKQDQEEK